ncbi:MAG: 16S rRNA (uracil(1498)-N(3))-methyltransferase [Nitrospira sp.]|nr:16S rRNA (uracil(1498)-N(3))-methyltransferase [Nitrospira sp.]
MSNFFIKNTCIKEDNIEISGEVFHHLRDSLRIKNGEKIFCVDEDRIRYTVTVREIRKDLLVGEIIKKEERKSVPPLYINLVQSIPKGPKFDVIIQKATELGVNTISPVISERSVVRLEKERSDEKLRRWNRIALEAAQQSDRRDIPDIASPVSLRDFLSSYKKGDMNLLLWEGEKRQGIKDVLTNSGDVKSINVIIGPEGGFSDNEAGLAVSAGFISVSLGELILRTETAPIAVLSILQYEYGHL